MPEEVIDDPTLDDDDLDLSSQAGGEVKEKKTVPPDDLRQIVTELASTVRESNKPKPVEEKELTQEQKDELWAVYNPEKTKKDFMRKFFRLNPDATAEEEQEARDLFKEMQSGITKQSIVGARNLIEIERRKNEDRFARLEEHVSKQRSKELKADFDAAYPKLADKKYAKAIAATGRLLANDSFKDEEEYFKALAEGAAEIVQMGDPSFTLSDGEQQTTRQQPGTTPRLPRTSVGGSGGAGGGKGTSGPKPKGDATDDFLADD